MLLNLARALSEAQPPTSTMMPGVVDSVAQSSKCLINGQVMASVQVFSTVIHITLACHSTLPSIPSRSHEAKPDCH